MKKDVLKKIAAALSFIAITGTCTTKLHAATHINKKQKTFIEMLTTKLEGFIKFTTNWTEAFFNRSNKESYNVHVDRMKAKLIEFEKEIVIPVKHHAPESGKYGRALKITKDVISRLYMQAKEVYNVLDRHRGKGAFRLGLAFKKVEKYSSRSAVNRLKNQLKQIQQLLNHIDPALGQKITAILVQVEKQLQKNNTRNNWEAFKALKYRIACTGGPAKPARTAAPKRAIATTIVANATAKEARRAKVAAKRAALEKADAQRRAKKQNC